MYSEISFKKAWNSTPNAAPQKSCQHSESNHQPTRQTSKGQTYPRCEDCANNHLTFSADIDHITAEGDTNTKSNQEQGRSLNQCLCKGIGTAESSNPKSLIRNDR